MNEMKNVYLSKRRSYLYIWYRYRDKHHQLIKCSFIYIISLNYVIYNKFLCPLYQYYSVLLAVYSNSFSSADTIFQSIDKQCIVLTTDDIADSFISTYYPLAERMLCKNKSYLYSLTNDSFWQHSKLFSSDNSNEA